MASVPAPEQPLSESHVPGVHRIGRLIWLAPALLIALSVAWQLCPTWPLIPISREYIDLQVYRLGVQAMWH
ncbi:MAG: hypothetical protein J2P18_12930, partial [Nocardia sp.]|nr:hypothetical protein [Nocardia sp.]